MDKNDKRMANLVPNSARTPSQRRENARKAGKASGLVRAQHKAMKETLLELLNMPMKSGPLTEAVPSIEDYKKANVCVRERIMMAMVVSAAKGNVKAAKFIRDTIGEAPVTEVKVQESAVCGLTDEQLRKIVNGEA